ncbi:undecaprenyl-phosphate glucose phosphotransferase [Candidatus Laterigemmans baculatus]|uniref:undecaprenyl-phosphate glucose phosphotransferase n=1 Tax=Candidatus Laterigemmans baculatus TaxID=2770505 RepID=UPI0013DD554D|nr:undecaprenyl-phosphate glucose phosphotransferase [Candidatus Laterigemmans baculatus]
MSTAIGQHRSVWDFVQPTLDATCILLSLYAVQWAALGFLDDVTIGAALLAAVVFPLASQLTGLQRQWLGGSTDREVIAIVGTWTLTVLTLALIGFLTRYANLLPRSVMVGWIVVAPCLVALARMCLRILQRALQQRGIGTRTVAIAGLNDLGCQVAHNIRRDPGLGFHLNGFYDDRDAKRLAPHSAKERLEGNLNRLVEQARAGQVDIVMITLPMRAEERIKYILDRLSDSTASVYLVPDFFVFELLHSRWTSMGGLPAVSVFENPLYGVDGYIKRVADVVLTLAALSIAAIPMLAIAVAVKLSSPGPVFFRQRRYGLDGREIRVWKFRSMRVCDDGPVVRQATKNDPRITRVGAILRKTSLDELPQLFNVLDGSMSLVGPRPHATAHNEEFRGLIRGYMLRHKIKPGITGLAQVSGCRGETETLDKMKRRVEYDHQYIRQWSIWLDLKILAKTLQVAWRQEEAY